MIIIGLTGGIGSGKSTVAELFEKLDVAVIDTDIIARELVQINTPAYQEIVKQFGDEILLQNHTIDRAALKQRIINNEEQRLKLEAILHPLIQQQVTNRIKTLRGHYCIIVIPLLVGKANYPMLDRILVIDAANSLQIERVSQRDGMGSSNVEKLIALQATREERLALADDVIVNEQDLVNLRNATQKMHDKYMKL